MEGQADRSAPTELPVMDQLATEQALADAQASGVWDDSIRSADEAIRRSLAEFPANRQATGTVVRLLQAHTLNEWRGSASPLLEDHVPVWLVAVTADGMSVGDGMPFFYGGGNGAAGGDPSSTESSLESTGREPIQGMYYAWDANGGYSLGVGVLGEQWPQNLASLKALVHQDLPITRATDVVLPDDPAEDPNAATMPAPDGSESAP
jgi:hypothetical protein